ncbi:signal peptide peptidase SppA [Hydrogenothermus marinus]|uniref:Protease-4 n=1 Tax=Hydrogenothermus marinus TaxID=133270 RepID=A0A3M0BIM0_9AQUI|nr:signal peptide peptidase SppA [Hydrogenothermus marinus]RMA96169.1 protease-4 [Hydrogenothermus marinus]
MKKKIIIGIITFIVLIWIISFIKAKSTPKIALIDIKGVIADYKPTLRYLNIAQKDSSIKAVVLNVDSPGGAVGASQEIYRAIEKLRKKKPVIVSMGNVAASGGYYISSAANVIYANPGTITGSIGVIVQHTDLTDLLNKLGIKINNIKSGKNKDILYPNHKLKPEEAKLIKETIIDVYEQFLDAVVKYRHLDKEKLRPYADGRIFSGRQALKLGLVDKLGNLQDAIQEARKMIGKEGKNAVVVQIGEEKSFIERLLKNKINLDLGLQSGIYYLLSF